MWRRGLFLTILLLFPLFSVTGQSEPGAADTSGSETSGKGDMPEGDAAAAYLYVLEEITFEIDRKSVV